MIKSKMRLIRTQSDALDRWIAGNYESHIRNEFHDGRPIDQVKINVFTIRPDDRDDYLVRFSSSDENIFTGINLFSSDENIFTGINLEYFCDEVCIFDGDLYSGFEKAFTELYAYETNIIRARMYCAYIENLNDNILFYIRNIIISEYNSNYL